MAAMTIGKLAKQTGTGIETIRFYEREGLLEQPERRVGSRYRQYDPDVAKRLIFIRRAKELGFTLKEIRELLTLRARTKSKCATVKARAEKKIADIELKIEDLNRIKRSLERLAARCHDESPTSECPILDALDSEVSS